MPIQNMNTFSDTGWHIRTLLEGATQTTSGVWQPVFGYNPFTVTVEGDFNGTVQIYGTNFGSRTAGPTDADTNHPPLLSVAVTGPQIFTIEWAINWVKAAVTFPNPASGACSCYAFVG